MNVQTKDGFSNDNGFNFVKEKVLTLIYLKWICPSFCMDKKIPEQCSKQRMPLHTNCNDFDCICFPNYCISCS